MSDRMQKAIESISKVRGALESANSWLDTFTHDYPELTQALMPRAADDLLIVLDRVQEAERQMKALDKEVG